MLIFERYGTKKSHFSQWFQIWTDYHHHGVNELIMSQSFIFKITY